MINRSPIFKSIIKLMMVGMMVMVMFMIIMMFMIFII